MPVIDLRGLVPSAPPENPGFSRTRRLAQGSPYEQALAFEERAADVRSLRGMSALQAMQNQQDQIAQQAQNLRLQQEAQMAAEQATQGLAGLDPANPDYLNKRQGILQQTPAALLDPQFRNALGVYDEGYSNIAKQQQAEQAQSAAQQKRINDLAVRAIEFGADPNEVAAYAEAGDINRIAQAIGTVRTSGKSGVTGKNPAISALKDNFDLLTEERKQYLDDAQPVPPEIEAEYQATRKQLFDARRSIYQPQQAQAPAQTAPSTAAVAKPAATVDAAKPVEQPAIQNVDLSKIPYSQREQYVKDLEEQAKEGEKINRAWFDAQKDLQSKLEKEIGTGNIGNTNYSKLRSFAEAVVNGETTPTGELGAGGEYRMDVPVGYTVLQKLGLSPDKPAFNEPGNRRTGTQQVTYDDLLKTWAKNYLGMAPVTVVPQVPALPAKKANILDSLLESSMKPSDG